MKILVVVDSKHGSTLGIGEALAERLREAGNQVDVRPATAAPSAREYSAIIVGSAIYMGSWREDAIGFIRNNEPVLNQREVWLFSSGPLGEDAHREDPPKQLDDMVRRSGAHEHRLFQGRPETQGARPG